MKRPNILEQAQDIVLMNMVERLDECCQEDPFRLLNRIRGIIRIVHFFIFPYPNSLSLLNIVLYFI